MTQSTNNNFDVQPNEWAKKVKELADRKIIVDEDGLPRLPTMCDREFRKYSETQMYDYALSALKASHQDSKADSPIEELPATEESEEEVYDDWDAGWHAGIASQKREDVSSLRDSFAGLAMQGMLGGTWPDTLDAYEISKRAYFMADVMMIARKV